jgi:heme exporter protein C
MSKITKINSLAIFFLTLLFIYAVFRHSPSEINQGYVQKIMYIHVPAIFMAYLAIFIVFFCSISYLWQASETTDSFALVGGELGALFCFIALITGSIWGKPTWNTYWTWDARITFTLILFLVFAGYSLIRYLAEDERIPKISAIIGISGFFAVPLNHLAVKWWRTLHQPSTIFSTKDTISPEIRNFLLLSMLYFLFLLASLFFLRLQYEKKKRTWKRELALMRQSHSTEN